MFFFLLQFVFGVSSAYATGSVRVSGFNEIRSRSPLLDSLGNAPNDFFEGTDVLVNELNNSSNFGSLGVVNCSIDFGPFMPYVSAGSLVSGGVRQYDIFFAGVTDVALTPEEADELASFINNGGIVYISGSAFGNEGLTYNLLFSALGVTDNFGLIDWSSFEGESSDPLDSPVTNGPFANVGMMFHGSFRAINTVSLTELADGFETGGIVVMSTTPGSGLSDETVLAEGGFGSGYLSVTGDAMYSNYYAGLDGDNMNYFLNLFASACKSSGGKQLNVPLFKQTDAIWGGLEYDNGNSQNLVCGSTISECGCVTSSVAMLLKYYGVDKAPDGRPTTPQTVNDYFRQNVNCNNSGCNSNGYKYGAVRWSAIGEYSADANKVFGTQKIIYNGPQGYDSTNLANQINADKPVILRVPGSQHWVIATGINGNTFNINDPAYNRLSLDDPAYGNSAVAMRSFQKTASDFSTFEVTSLAPTQILVTDSSGRRTGFDSVTLTVMEEIPNSYYYFEESYADPSGSNPSPPDGSGIYTVLIMTPQQDDYEVEIVSEDNELYSFSVHATDSDAGLDLALFEDTKREGEDHKYNFLYDPVPGGETNTREIEILIRPFKKRRPPKVKRRWKILPVAILSSPTFNAREEINRETITFGKTGNEESLGKCIRFPIDVNRDGYKDLVCLFKMRRTGISKGDNEAIIKARTRRGTMVQGVDLISVR